MHLVCGFKGVAGLGGDGGHAPEAGEEHAGPGEGRPAGGEDEAGEGAERAPESHESTWSGVTVAGVLFLTREFLAQTVQVPNVLNILNHL